MKADLHMHSTYSDGRYTMRELIDEAKNKGIDIIAITDHDIVGDMDDVIGYGNDLGITVLPAIELSTLEQNKSVHILGYFRDESYKSDELLSYFKEIKFKREQRAKGIIQNLKDYYDIHISYEQVRSHSSGIIARPHIAKALQEAYPIYSHDAIFDQFLGDHTKAYIPSVELPVQDGLDLLHRHNCVAVLAHPTLLKPHIKDTVLQYQYDGIEATYPLNKENEEMWYKDFASSKKMITTAGSDFHGIKGDTKHGDLGDLYLEGEELQIFLNQLQKN